MQRTAAITLALLLCVVVANLRAVEPPRLLPIPPAPSQPAPQRSVLRQPLPVPPSAPAQPPAVEPAPPVAIPPGFSRLMTELVREYLPHEYDDTKNWDLKQEIQSGLKVFMDKGRPTSRRTFKEVNHGTWTKAHFELIDPEHDFDVRVLAVRTSPNGQPEMDIVINARVKFEARMSRWQWGVQLVSLSAEGTARIELRMTCEMAMTFDLAKLPPDVILRPNIRSTDLRVTEYRVHKVSKLGGEFAEQLGKLTEGMLKRKLEEQGDRLAEKLNKKIAKNADRWRFSPADMAAAGWEKFTGAGSKEEGAAEK